MTMNTTATMSMNAADAGEAPATCVVACGATRLRLPPGCIEEFVRPGESAPLVSVGDARVIDLRGTLVPVIDAGPLLGSAPCDPTAVMAVVLRALPGAPPAAVLFDAVDRLDAGEPGDADLPVADLADLFVRAGYPELARGGTVAAEAVAPEDEAGEPEAEQLLIVDVGPGRSCAVPLREVRRVDEPEAGEIVSCGTGLVVKVGRRLLPVVSLLEARLGLGPRQPILVVGDEERPVALAVEQIRDIAVADAGVPALAWNRQGISEVRVVGNATVGVVDVPELLRARGRRAA